MGPLPTLTERPTLEDVKYRCTMQYQIIVYDSVVCCVLVCDIIVDDIRWTGRSQKQAAAKDMTSRLNTTWVLRDVVFQDVGFENNCFKPLTHISVRCEVTHLQWLRVNKLSLSNPILLKPHIPEFPNYVTELTPGLGASRGGSPNRP